MKLQFFSVNALEPEADQAAIDDFSVRHRLVSVDKRFVERGEFCYWSVCITYLEASTSPTKPTVTAINKRGQVDYREVLGDKNLRSSPNYATCARYWRKPTAYPCMPCSAMPSLPRWSRAKPRR